VAVPLLHVELQPDSLYIYQPAVGVRRLLAVVFNPFGGMLGLRGIDADIMDNNAVPKNAANLDGVAVDDADNLDRQPELLKFTPG
jgi:hypothetical protein